MKWNMSRMILMKFDEGMRLKDAEKDRFTLPHKVTGMVQCHGIMRYSAH